MARECGPHGRPAFTMCPANILLRSSQCRGCLQWRGCRSGPTARPAAFLQGQRFGFGMESTGQQFAELQTISGTAVRFNNFPTRAVQLFRFARLGLRNSMNSNLMSPQLSADRYSVLTAALQAPRILLIEAKVEPQVAASVCGVSETVESKSWCMPADAPA